MPNILNSVRKSKTRLTLQSQLERSINSLLGLIEGVAADRILNRTEIGFLEQWLGEHADVCNSHPYNELMPCLAAAVHAGKLSEEEKENLSWLCEKMRQTAYCDRTSADMQRLRGILDGIIADSVITVEELDGLRDWLEDHRELRTCWPYDEVDSLITEVLRDQRIDEAEQQLLQKYFAGFVNESEDRTITSAPILAGDSIDGLYAVDPEIRFEESRFCFTGASSRFARDQLAQFVVERGGEFVNGISRFVDYLVVGAEGNPAWAFACYGRKIQQAVELRRKGAKLLIIHENDFHDAVASTARLSGCADYAPPKRSNREAILDTRLNSPQMREGDLVVLDFETTGLYPNRGDRITEVAAVRMRNGRVVELFESLVNCGVPVHPDIVYLNGITQAMIDDAPPPSHVMRKLVNFLGTDLVIAHHAPFDERFFRSECEYLGLPAPEPFVCSLKMAKRAYPNLESYKLQQLAEALRLPHFGKAHRAAADARLTAELVIRMRAILYSDDRKPGAFRCENGVRL